MKICENTQKHTTGRTNGPMDQPTDRQSDLKSCVHATKRLVDYLFGFNFLVCQISHSDVENLLHSTDEKRQKDGMASSRILMLLSEKITGRVLILMAHIAKLIN